MESLVLVDEGGNIVPNVQIALENLSLSSIVTIEEELRKLKKVKKKEDVKKRWKETLKLFNEKLFFFGYTETGLSFSYRTGRKEVTEDHKKRIPWNSLIMKELDDIRKNLVGKRAIEGLPLALNLDPNLFSLNDTNVLYVGFFLPIRGKKYHLYVGITYHNRSAPKRWGTQGGTDHLGEVKQVMENDGRISGLELTRCAPVMSSYPIRDEKACVCVYIFGKLRQNSSVDLDKIESEFSKYLHQKSNKLDIVVHFRGNDRLTNIQHVQF